jgi:hypothetical protein
MASLGQYALPGIVVLSAFGALIMCVLVFRYGFTMPADEDEDEAAHRLFITRFGHALAGVCFAVAAMLAVIAFSAQMRAARAPTPTVRETAAAETVRELEARVDRRLAEMEERLAEVTASVERSAQLAVPPPAPPPARQSPRAELPRPAARPSVSPAPTVGAGARIVPGAPVTDDEASALPANVGTNHFRTTIQGIGVDVLSGAGREGHTIYSIRLTDVSGRPLNGADVALVGQMADGTAVQMPLPATGEPGLYRGRVTSGQAPRDVRLRVVASHRRFELSLAQGVSW